MEATEMQRVLVVIDTHPQITLSEIVGTTGLGVTVVEMLVDKLRRSDIIDDPDERGHWVVTRWGNELLTARTAEVGRCP